MIISVIFISVLALVGVVSVLMFGWLWGSLIVMTMIAAVMYLLHILLFTDSKRALTAAELYDRSEFFD